MNVAGKVAIVTGGAGGIGKALAKALLAEGAKGVMIADLNADAVAQVAAEIGCSAMACDVTDEAQIQALVARTEAELGPIALFCSNAGVLDVDPDIDDATSASNAAWERSWRVNVMAHVFAARAVLPGMKARGEGHFLHTVSAAGLLSQIGSGPYSVTKHAGIGFAEHLAIAHRDDNIRVSMLCPQGVDTAMIRTGGDKPHPALMDGVLSPDAVAACAISGIKEGRFLILPHPKVAEYFANKAADYERWIGGMVKLRRVTKAAS
jgi:NAD(P)-dependent dehydrogenase (short-subunit alcohol dehydrogenase family)